MKKIYTYLALCTFFTLYGCGSITLDESIEDGAVKMTSFEIKDLLSGSKIEVDGYEEVEEITFLSEGKIAALNDNQEPSGGTWKINDNAELCLTFEKWETNDTPCSHIYRDEDDFKQFNNDGELKNSFIILKQGTLDFQEGIVYKDKDKKDNSTAGAKSSDANATQQDTRNKTAEDIKYFVRQTARKCPGCNLEKAQLSQANLAGANLEGANLTQANLEGAILKRANLRGANLEGANLKGANLKGADLTGAVLTNADLTDAQTQGTKGL